jgi:predicted ester cyclase
MSLEDQKNIARRALNLWASNNSEKPEDIVSTNYINHQEPDAAGGATVKNLKEWNALLKGYHDAFSNSQVEILMQIAEGNLVATRWKITAIHTGTFAGLAPTNRQSTWTGVDTDRFENNKIVESWINWDKASFLEGLGIG